MAIEEVLVKFEGMSRDRPELFTGSHVVRDVPLLPDDFSTIEESSKVQFPSSFRTFITRIGAGDFAFTSIYSPDARSDWSLWRHIEQFSLPKSFVPFADNGCGDYYGFMVKDGCCGEEVWWADHEAEYAVSRSEYGNFAEFLLNIGLNLHEERA
jgi:hypothetical protein